MYNGDKVEYSQDEYDTIKFVDNTLYWHKPLHFNYTTYNLHRQQDSINPRTHLDIILLFHEETTEDAETHSYWHARVIGIFHVNVVHTSPYSRLSQKQQINFLWIWWFECNLSFNAGWQAQRLYRIGFLDAIEPGAFGFLDPAQVIHGVHLILAFV